MKLEFVIMGFDEIVSRTSWNLRTYSQDGKGKEGREVDKDALDSTDQQAMQ